MRIYSNKVEMSKTDIFRRILEGESEEIFVIGVSEETIEAFLGVLGELDDPPRVRVLTRESVLKWVRDDFVLASAAADFLDAEMLSVRTTGEGFKNVLVATEGTVVSLVSAGEQIAGLVTDDGEFVENVRERWRRAWEDAEEFNLRTPARSRVEGSLAAEFGPEVESDFRTMVEALGSTRGERNNGSDGLDEVGVSLLVAAKHGELLYDISKWGEDVGVASKATFSRTKNSLEERGLIKTEKVPIDVGRPRLRLLLGNEELREADAEVVVSAAQGLLSRISA